METEKENVISEDSSSGAKFPRPDFTEIISEYPPSNEPPSIEKSDPPPTKPTFKNILQAKKRLQAFSSRTGSLPVSPISTKKPKSSEEKSEEGSPSPRKTKKLIYHDDRARAVIEEIEEIKRQEERLDDFRQNFDHSRSRSHSKERFKRVGRKSRNYRRRSSSPETAKKTIKSPEPAKKPLIKKKYPKNWHEFDEFEATFETIREQYVAPIKKNNEIVQQMQFELPSLPITPYSATNAKGVEKEVPFENIRYTRTKPIVCYSANNCIKPRYVSKKFLLGLLPKDHVSNLEKLYSNSIKFKRESGGKTRHWYSKTWKHSETEGKLIEKSVGLSFLQNYHGEEDENEGEVTPAATKKAKKTSEKKVKKKKKEKSAKRKLKKKEKRKKSPAEKKVKVEKDEKAKRKRKVSEVVEQDEPKRVKTEKISKNETEICDKQEKHDSVVKTEPKSELTKARKKHSSSEEEVEEEEEEEKTPDTDDYHSLWESDDDVPSTAIPRPSLKPNRSWESDEELFDRTYSSSKPKPTENYTSLEIPLNIQTFSRRPEKLDAELRLLEEERRTLSEERKKLEIEKQKIMRMQEESLLTLKEEPKTPPKLEPPTPSGLENEYEEFIKAVSSTDVVVPTSAPAPVAKKKSRVSSESSDSSSSSSSDSSDSDSHKKKKRRKRKKKRKIEGLLPGKDNNIFNEFDIPVPSELPEMVPPILPPPPPLPVPSPALPILPSCIPVLLNLEEKEIIESVPKLDDDDDEDGKEKTPVISAEHAERVVVDEVVVSKPFVFPSITLAKKNVLEKTKVNLNDDEEEDDELLSTDFTEKFSKSESSSATKAAKNSTESKSKSEPKAKKIRSRSRSREKRRRETSSPKRRFSPVSRRRSSPPRRRRSSPVRRRRRSRSLSPLRSRNGRSKRTPSPRTRRSSPLNSPLDGFKRSVADSTISDDMLPQPSGFVESPNAFHKRGSLSPSLANGSPRRISLDDRINQVLGLEKSMEAAPVYANSFGGYGGYEQQQASRYQYAYGQYGNKNNEYAGSGGGYSAAGSYLGVKHAPSKVVQVGNILQVVPSEEIQNVVLEQKPIETQQKIVQVGNMLQIVPAVLPTASSKPPIIVEAQIPQALPIISQTAATLPVAEQIVVPSKPEIVQSAESLMKQKKLERKAEREKRRLDRDRRRKDKEKKRKEKDKRKQIKQKLKTENLIKRALQMETESQEDDENEEEEEEPAAASISVIVSTPTLSSNKSILLSSGSRTRKSVQFADGIRPGEGTSPSGGEELSSPPPQKPQKTVQDAKKRVSHPKSTKHHHHHHQEKKSKKKKIKVKVIKKVPVASVEEDDEDEIYENLPPPSPPPGSPPPHVFPPRIKLHTVNNVHQYNILNSPVPGYGFRPSAIPIVLNRASGAAVQHPHGYLSSNYHPDLNSIPHAAYQGVPSRH